MAGLGAGAIDAGINVYAAERFSPRLVSWLHASWSAGAALGPLIMTAVLTAGLAWRWGYVVVAAIVAAMALTFFATLGLWGRAPAGRGRADVPPPTSTFLHTLAPPVVWAHMAVFFLYTGLEAERRAVGVHPAHRGAADPARAWRGRGSAATGRASPWAGSSAGWPPIGSRPAALLRASMVSALLAAALVWADRGPAATLAGLALLGFSLAPVFPHADRVHPRAAGRRARGARHRVPGLRGLPGRGGHAGGWRA